MLIGHKKQWEFLKAKFENDQLSHAYLFSGADELGRKTFAKEFIKFINNQKTAENHPDVMMINSEAEIQIAQIRQVQNFLSLKPYYSKYKTVIVDQAERMNQEAQSCFLKTLEEPRGKTILILLSSRPEMLLGTILSRCQEVKFANVSKEEIKKELLKKTTEKEADLIADLAEGKPGRAMKLMEDKTYLDKEKEVLDNILDACSKDLSKRFQYIKALPDESILNTFRIFKKFLRSALLNKTGIEGNIPDTFKNIPMDKMKEIVRFADEIDFKLLTTNANPKLALEVLLIQI